MAIEVIRDVAELPTGFQSFGVQDGSRPITRGFLYNPAEDPKEALIFGAANTFGSEMFGRYCLIAAIAQHQKIGAPVLAFESLGVGGSVYAPKDGSKRFSLESTLADRREAFARVFDGFGLIEKSLYYEGCSQAALNSLVWAEAGSERADDFGLSYKAMALFDTFGVKKLGSLRGYARLFAKTMLLRDRFADRPVDDESTKVDVGDAPRNLPIGKMINLNGSKWGMNSEHTKRILAYLLPRHPNMHTVLVSCHNGNSVFTEKDYQQVTELASEFSNLTIVAPERLAHQWTDIPSNRADFLAAVIAGSLPEWKNNVIKK